MRRRALFLAALVVAFIGIGLAFWLWPHALPAAALKATPIVAMAPSSPPVGPSFSTPNSSAPAVNIPNIPGHPLAEHDKQSISKIITVFSAPISFWGKVIDQNKQPVEGANIHYEAIDHYFGQSTAYQGSSDHDGLFSINGIGGAGLYVRVSKDGYYQLGEKSMRGFHTGSNDMPSRDNPVIFELRKRGETEQIIMIQKIVKIPRNGTPTSMSLTTGQTFNVQQGDIQVQAWTNDASVPVNSGRHYDWRCKITVSGGGLQSRIGQFDFEAPTDGYQPSNEIDMPANADQWRQQVQKSYFVQLGNGDFARIDFQMIAGGDHFFTITSYLNPTPGHRNLEYDPNQTASK
jgi:hypothetical protein